MNNKSTVRVMRAFAGHWLSKAESDTKRNLRKLIEFGSYFSGSVQIKKFFVEAHKILKSSKSKYYILAHNLIKNVDKDRITEFGISFGYNGFVKGMKEIHTAFSGKEDSCALAGIIRNINDNPITGSEDLGKSLAVSAQNGAAMYFVFCDEFHLSSYEIKNSLEKYPYNAFFLFTEKEDIALHNDHFNALPVLNFIGDDFSAACEKLKNQKRLFGAYLKVDNKNADEILCSDFLEKVQKKDIYFLFLLIEDGCEKSLKEKVNLFSYNQKRKPTHPIFISELFGDLEWLNSVSRKN